MRNRHLFSRWIRRELADRYVSRFSGKVYNDINGYSVLYSSYRIPLAFVKR